MKTGGVVVRGLVLTAACLVLFGAFYYVYVPLIPSFQLVLVPLLLFTAVLTIVRVEWGTLWFIFAFPLFNSLPYFFGIDETIPHAPLALVLFLSFFVGWIARSSFTGWRLRFPGRLARPLALLSGVVIVSGLVTFWRYANFPPLVAERIRELVVNVNGVRAGGALMSDVFNALNYLSGFLLLGILGSVLKTRSAAKKWLAALSLSAGLSLAVSLGQRFVSIRLGNLQTWVGLGQLNATFKDPNAFGAYLSAVLPVFLAMALAFRKGLRVVSLVLAGLIVFIFPSTGSRSGFLAVCVSLGVFSLLLLAGRKGPRRSTAIRSLAVLSAYVVIVLVLTSFQGGSRLSQRLGGDLETAAEGNFVSRLTTGKLALWEVAGRMVKDYPATGVGLGAYIIELPNYLRSLDKSPALTDSAENYFIQAAAEMGLAGFGLVLWVFVIVFKGSFRRVRANQKDPCPPDENSHLSIGVFCGLVAFAVNFLFHSYIGSPEAMYAFWFLVALSLLEFPHDGTNGVPAARRPVGTVAAVALVAIFGLSHLWNSTRSLSLGERARRFGWSQNFGLYEPERDPERYPFQWTRPSAGLTVENPGLSLVIPMKVAHPDLEQRPVRTKVFLADASFRKKDLLREIVFSTRDWVDFEYLLRSPPPSKVFLVFETDRAWQPRRFLAVPDTRQLALALGEVWFRYPSAVIGLKATLRYTVPAQSWAGKLGSMLIANGLSRTTVILDRPEPVLRLWLKGQKALGVGPLVTVRLDGRVIAKTMVQAEEWAPFVLTPHAGAGEHALTVEFTNDFYDPKSGQDRNVYLGPVDILNRE